MPQLIAMVIVVVGAMIYMFQTFGGTGDKIEGIAQKTSIITEINNIRNGLQLAVRADEINTTPTVLSDLAALGYFADQMNNEIADNAGTVLAAVAADTVLTGDENTYSAISFGGENNPGMYISMVVGAVGSRPGIRVQFVGELANNADFLETQIANDLAAIAAIDRTTLDGSAVVLLADGEVPVGNRPVNVVDIAGTPGTVAAGTATLTDGVFTIYFKDMPARIVAP
jgi:hypothetical protein